MKHLLAFALSIAFVAPILADGGTNVTVYTMPGCGRCSFTISELNKQRVPFTERSTSDPAAKRAMWDLIGASGKHAGGGVSMPVIVVKGAVHFSIADLRAFVASIPSLLSGSSTPAKPDGGKAAAPDGFAREITDRHNHFRKMHGAPALSWSPAINAYAQEWADRLAREDRMYHRSPNKYGENIYWISGGRPGGASPVNSWYAEIKDYDFRRPGFSMGTGHFTQVVWAGSTELGCGRATSRRGGTYVVCNYNPPGNYAGRFPANVRPAGSAPAQETAALPTFMNVWTYGNAVVNRPYPGWAQKRLPIANHYTGAENGVYVAVYSRTAAASVYPVGGGIHVMGLIRLKGTWNGRIAEPDGWAGRDISAAREFKRLAGQYYQSCGGDCWVGGDTGGFFGKR
ncbi:MAG TPA: CAP domain-containing protein [Spirochaetota bacterium]|nr:CAP domain-containing protein [Spirochaetota bacterium]